MSALTREQVEELVKDDAYNTVTPERAKAIIDAFDALWVENERLKDLVARHEHSIPIMQQSATALIRGAVKERDEARAKVMALEREDVSYQKVITANQQEFYKLEQQLAASEQRGDMLERELASLKAVVGWPHTGARP